MRLVDRVSGFVRREMQQAHEDGLALLVACTLAMLVVLAVVIAAAVGLMLWTCPVMVIPLALFVLVVRGLYRIGQAANP